MGAKTIIGILKAFSDIMCENRDYLINLDSVVGDGDLGLTMSDGFTAAYKAVENSDEADCGKLLYMAGKAMGAAVPSSMGTLMASGFMQAAKQLKGVTELKEAELISLFEAYAEGVMNRGKAKVGEKTFLDGLCPAVEAMKKAFEEGAPITVIASRAAIAAKEGFENTATMVAKHGRAAVRGENSRSLLDPGAAVAMLMMKAIDLYFSKITFK